VLTLLAVLFFFVVAVIAAAVAIGQASRALRRIAALERRLDDLRRKLDTIEHRLEETPAPPPPPSVFGERSSSVRVFEAPANPLATDTSEATTAPPVSPIEAEAAPSSHTAVRRETLEQRIGARWLLYAGIAAVFVASAWFIRHAFENDWVTPPMRIALGFAGGATLIALGERAAARGLARYGEALTGAGVGVFYIAVYAAYAFYGLVGRWTAFVMMAATTALTYLLAARHRSQGLAFIAVAGGFATPWLIGDPHVPLALYAYLGVLVAGTLAVVARHDWPLLNAASYALTVWTLADWASDHYVPTLWLGTEMFLIVFLALFAEAWRRARRSASRQATWTSALLATSPLAFHLASLAILQDHRGAMLVYFIAFTLAGLIVARAVRSRNARALAWLGAAIPCLAWVTAGRFGDWYSATLVTIAAIFVLHELAQWESIRAGHADDDHRAPALPAIEVALLHANGWWALAAAAVVVGSRYLSWQPSVAFGLALANVGLAAAYHTRSGDAAIHHLVLAWGLAAAGVTLQLDGAPVTIAWAAEGAGLVWLGLRSKREWVSVAGAGLLALAVFRALFGLTEPLPLSSDLVLNARVAAAAFVVAMLYVCAWLLGSGSARAVAIVAANVVTVATLSAEVSAWFDWRAYDSGVRDGSPGGPARDLVRQATLSVLWALYAVGLVAFGIWRRYPPIRYFAIALFALTIAKVLAIDVATLDRPTRMVSMLAIGVLLLVASYLYQRLARPGRDAGLPTGGAA
jgi:uncharacterized membrane protein